MVWRKWVDKVISGRYLLLMLLRLTDSMVRFGTPSKSLGRLLLHIDQFLENFQLICDCKLIHARSCSTPQPRFVQVAKLKLAYNFRIKCCSLAVYWVLDSHCFWSKSAVDMKVVLDLLVEENTKSAESSSYFS